VLKKLAVAFYVVLKANDFIKVYKIAFSILQVYGVLTFVPSVISFGLTHDLFLKILSKSIHLIIRIWPQKLEERFFHHIFNV
jgi:hypothetical protein